MRPAHDDATRQRKLQAVGIVSVPSPPASGTDPVVTESLTLKIALRRTRLVLLVTVSTLLVIIVTATLSHGAELKRFDRNDMTSLEQTKLLDRYNSYSGNIASAIGRPIEIFVALMAQVLALWLMTDSVFSFRSSWRVRFTVMALGASVGFLLTNSLNALNVQIHELPATLVISTSDLSVPMKGLNSSTVEHSFSEHSAGNPSTNTILRNLIHPHVPITVVCNDDSPYGMFKDDRIAYGISQRSWMKNFIPHALPTSTIRFDLKGNTTNATVDNLPMSASSLTDLLFTAANTLTLYAPFDLTPLGKVDQANDPWEKWYPLSNTSNPNHPPGKERQIPASRYAGLLPPDPNSSETQDREWLLARLNTIVRNVTVREWQNASLLFNWTLDVSRINITPSVWVDAITITSERVVNQSTYGGAKSSTGLRIIITNGSYPDSVGGFSDARIDAYAGCTNLSAVETIQPQKIKNVTKITKSLWFSCPHISNTSMYVFSSGRYLQADALDQAPKSTDGSVRTGGAVNLRVVYSATFARLSWKFQDLAKVYDATCEVNDGCMGLDANLSTNQRLLVSSGALPLDHLRSVNYNNGQLIFPPQPFEIVSVHRPFNIQSAIFLSESTIPQVKDMNFSGGNDPTTQSLFGDILLQHNIAKNVTVDNLTCFDRYDRRVQNYVNNHMYMESTLQPTYTAAAFFLFQNGMARDVLKQTALYTILPLQFDKNVQEMSVWLSVPTANACLTFAGCGMLVGALAVALVRLHFASRTQDHHVVIQDVHQVARVMVDDTTFPSLLLKRRIHAIDAEGDADQFVIDSLTVRRAVSQAVEPTDTKSAV